MLVFQPAPVWIPVAWSKRGGFDSGSTCGTMGQPNPKCFTARVEKVRSSQTRCHSPLCAQLQLAWASTESGPTVFESPRCGFSFNW